MPVLRTPFISENCVYVRVCACVCMCECAFWFELNYDARVVCLCFLSKVRKNMWLCWEHDLAQSICVYLNVYVCMCVWMCVCVWMEVQYKGDIGMIWVWYGYDMVMQTSTETMLVLRTWFSSEYLLMCVYVCLRVRVSVHATVNRKVRQGCLHS